MLKNANILRWGYPWLILWVCCIHVLIGMCLVVREQTEKLLIISGLNRLVDLPFIDRYALAAILIVTACLAVIGLVFEGQLRPKACFALLMGQYGLVFGSCLSDMLVIYNGVNPSTGLPVDRVLMLVVLAPILLAGPLHTVSIIERFVIDPRRTAL